MLKKDGMMIRLYLVSYDGAMETDGSPIVLSVLAVVLVFYALFNQI